MSTKPKPRVRTEVRILYNILHERGKMWTKGKTIALLSTEHTTSGKKWHQRDISLFASLAGGAIISDAVEGYILSDNATDAEIFRSNYQKMKKALGTERRARAEIAYAKRRGRLKDRPQALVEIHTRINKELDESQPTPVAAEPEAQGQLFE